VRGGYRGSLQSFESWGGADAAAGGKVKFGEEEEAPPPGQRRGSGPAGGIEMTEEMMRDFQDRSDEHEGYEGGTSHGTGGMTFGMSRDSMKRKKEERDAAKAKKGMCIVM